MDTDTDLTQRPPRLTLWLGAATALALIVGMLGTLTLVWQRATTTAEQAAEQRARLVVDGMLLHELHQRDASVPATPARAAQWDALVFAPLRASSGAVRVSMFRADGTVLYSSTPALIGTRPDDLENVRAALAGHVTREVSHLDGDAPQGDHRKVLEVYVPIPGEAGRPPAAFELYEDYAQVSADARSTLVPLALLLAVMAVVFMGILMPVVRRVTATLHRRNREITRQAEQLRHTLWERETASAALIESDTRLRLMLRQLPALLITADTDLTVTSVNGQAFTDDWCAQLTPGHALAIDAADDDAPLLQAHRAACDGQSAGCEITVGGRTLAAHVEPLRDGDGAIVGTICLALDVTAQREGEARRASLEEELRQSQKLESLGQLAAGIAHDFNNVLTAIRLSAELLQSGMAPDDPQRGLADQVLAATERASAMTGRLLAFSRREPTATDVVDVNEAVRHVDSLLRPMFGEGVEVHLELAPGQLCVRGDQGLIEQAVINLALNARDAMPQGGTVTMTTAAHRADGEEQVTIVVADTGSGIDPKVAADIFDPFVTTKAAGQGTGLGLASVKRTVTQMGGQISVTSERNVGASFTIALPRTDVVAEQRPAAVLLDEQLRGDGATVLLVEDDDQVRQFAARIMRDHGFTVICADDGAQGLAMADELEGRLDVLVTDVALPWVGGTDLARMVRDVHHDLPVVFISGHAGAEVRQVSGHALFVPKPFGRKQLLGAVCEAIAAHSPLTPQPR